MFNIVNIKLPKLYCITYINIIYLYLKELSYYVTSSFIMLYIYLKSAFFWQIKSMYG
jgi:hypothetical protein